MACGELTLVFEKRLYTDTSTVRYEGLTVWIPISSLGRIKAVVRLHSVTGNLQWALAWQFATTRTDDPGSWNDTGSFSTSGSCTGEITTVSAAGKMFVRFGMAYESSSDGQACVDIQISYDNPGSVVGSRSFVARAVGTSNSFEDVTGWQPVMRVTNVKVAIIASPQTGSYLKWRPSYQLATLEVGSPDAWVTSWGEEQTGSSSPVEYTSQNLTLSNASGSMWVRVGLQYWLSQAGQSQADITMVVIAWC